MRKELFAIGMIMDLSSPHSVPVLKQSFGENKVIVYPLRSKTANGQESTCNHVIHEALKGPEIGEWVSKQNLNTSGQIPLAEAINKLEFELQFQLYPCQDAIIISDGKDTCKADPCKALKKLERTLAKRREVLRLQVVGPLSCDIKRGGPLLVEYITDDQISQLSKLAQSPLPKELLAQIGTKKKVGNHGDPSQSPLKIVKANIQIGGPPVVVQFDWLENSTGKKGVEPFKQRIPAVFSITPGQWKMTIVSPTWVNKVKPVEKFFESGSEYRLSVSDLFTDQITWVDSSREEDELLVMKDQKQSLRVLVPQNSPPVPIPSSMAWKLVSLPRRK